MAYSVIAKCYWIIIVVIFKSGFVEAKPVCKFGAQLNKTGEECICQNTTCPDIKEQICGSDAITYNNLCELNRQACKNQTPLFKFKQGVCGPVPGMACSLYSCAKTPYEVCPAGNVQNAHGCLKCQCRNRVRQPCTLLTCPVCRFGHIIDANSCPTCKCKESSLFTPKIRATHSTNPWPISLSRGNQL